MPGFVTHYLFGVDAYKKMRSLKLKHDIKINHSAFALGLQGPDLFFYYLPSYLMHKENIGSLAHSKHTGTFFYNLLKSRELFCGMERELAVADAYILGFIGHYTLDCTLHPYVYAFTGYTPENPPSNMEYFGQHAYFETEIDNVLIYRKKHILPSQFQQYTTIRLKPYQHHVIIRMLVYAYQNTYPDVPASEILLGNAPQWMMFCTRLLNDPSGQKKVMTRFVERIIFHRAFLSPMLPSDHIRFIADPCNHRHRTWVHPWTNNTSKASFEDLYLSAKKQYLSRIHAYQKLVDSDFAPELLRQFLNEYGSLSFQSGLPC